MSPAKGVSVIMSGNLPIPGDVDPPDKASPPETPSIIDLLMSQVSVELDDIKESTLDELAALDELDDLDDLDASDDLAGEPLPMAAALSPLAQVEEPELVSFESLDNAEEPDTIGEDSDEVEDLLEDVEDLIEDYIDIDLDDDELLDEGYDLDDDDVGSYRDLYGEDDTIIPSFREGDYAEEEESESAYYDDLR